MLNNFSISLIFSDVDLKELADIVPVLGLLVLTDSSLELALLLFPEELSVILVMVLPIDLELGQELEDSPVVVFGVAGCNIAGWKPMGDSCGSLRSMFECLGLS